MRRLKNRTFVIPFFNRGSGWASDKHVLNLADKRFIRADVTVAICYRS